MPAESVAFTYDGANAVSATITGAQIGKTYLLITADFGDLLFAVADADPFVIGPVGAGATDPGEIFQASVINDTEQPGDDIYVGWTLCQRGSASEFPFEATWDYDGDKTVSVTFFAENGVEYGISVYDQTNGTTDSSTDVGTGAPMTLELTLVSAPSPDYFRAWLWHDTPSDTLTYHSVRLFTPELAGAGFPGNPTEAGPVPAPVIVLDRPIWKWAIVDLKTSRLLTLLTTFATEISTSRLLAASWPASLKVPADDPRVRTTYEQFEDPDDDEPFVAEGVRALIGFRDTGTDPLWEVAYTGMVRQCFDGTTDGQPYTTVNAWDVRKYLESLPLVDESGNEPGPDGLLFDAVKANVVARAAVENWIDNNPGCLLETLLDLTSGTDEDCAEVTITFQRGTTIAQVWSQLEDTGAIDITLDPIFDPRTRPGVLSVVNFEVEHGQARPAAIFSWDRSPRSLPEISRMEDGLLRANDVRGFTDAVDPVTPVTDTDSIAKYGEYVSLRVWTGVDDELAVAAFSAEELLFRKNGVDTVAMTPATPRALQPVQEFDYGDRVPVYASERLRKPIAATARIYGIPFTIGDDTRETVAELQVSADAVA